ncbi:hypothetical protein NMY22_g7576 [Coprinellus aureogranulatus]|nr:hypothetical protein NMY22_g7576 [Coprinellus aureogranulatus]
MYTLTLPAKKKSNALITAQGAYGHTFPIYEVQKPGNLPEYRLFHAFAPISVLLESAPSRGDVEVFVHNPAFCNSSRRPLPLDRPLQGATTASKVKKLLANLFGHQGASPARPGAVPTEQSPLSPDKQAVGPADQDKRTNRGSTSTSSPTSGSIAHHDQSSVNLDTMPEVPRMSTSMPSPIGALPSGLPGFAITQPEGIFNVEGLVAVITGGGTGIGLMMAKALEHNGATVYIIGRRKHVLEAAAKEHALLGESTWVPFRGRSRNPCAVPLPCEPVTNLVLVFSVSQRFNRIIPLQGDITDRASLLSIASVIKHKHGYVDLLVNNAAIASNLYPHPLPSPSSPSSDGGSSIKAFQDTLWDCGSPTDFADTFATNVTAPYYTTVAFLELLHAANSRRMKQSGQLANEVSIPYQTSQVLTVSSSGGFRIDAKVLSPSYTLAKAATTHLGKLLANLLAPWGIRSNVLAPGVFPSEMTMAVAPGVKLDPNVLASGVPLQRTGTEEVGQSNQPLGGQMLTVVRSFQDMMGTILFLASRAGAYVNGAVWLVDGGRVATLASSMTY